MCRVLTLHYKEHSIRVWLCETIRLNMERRGDGRGDQAKDDRRKFNDIKQRKQQRSDIMMNKWGILFDKIQIVAEAATSYSKGSC